MNRKIAAFQVGIVFLASGHFAEAQEAHRIGLVSPSSASAMASRVEAFRQGLREFGYIEGQNITIEYRWGEGKDERLTELVSELVGLNIGILATHGVVATIAARNASPKIPIVCFDCGDLVSTGVIKSLARPGGYITGVTLIHPETSTKRLELLKEIVPGLTRLAVLYNSRNPVSQPELESIPHLAPRRSLRRCSESVRWLGTNGHSHGIDPTPGSPTGWKCSRSLYGC